MKGLKPSITNQQGITLIQVIITLALVGVMAMMLMRMTTIMQKNQASLEKNVEVDFFMKKMGSFLISKDSCYNTFKDMVLPLDTAVNVDQILDSNSTPQIDIPAGIGTEIGTTIRNSTSIASITVTRIAAAEARLSFRFDRGEDQSRKRYYGARFFNKNIPIILQIDPSDDSVDGCYGDLNNSLEASCDKLGGEFDPVSGTCLMFDLVFNQHSSLQCESIGGEVVLDVVGPDSFKFCKLPYNQFELVQGWTRYKNFTETNTDPVPVDSTTVHPPECLPAIAANSVPETYTLVAPEDGAQVQNALNDFNATNPGTPQYKAARGAILLTQCTPPASHTFQNAVEEECTTPRPAGSSPGDEDWDCGGRLVKAKVLFIGVY